ncbi:MAG: hypothetical protein RL266_657 [Bacteroidota bacterium]
MYIFGYVKSHHFIIVLLFLASSFAAFGQNGLPFMTDIELNRQFNDSRISSIVQDGEKSMLFSTSRGLIKFDGSAWQRISTPSPTQRVVYHPMSKRIFVGLKQGVVEVSRSDSGTYEVKSIPGIDSRQPFSQILCTDQDIFLLSDNEMFSLSPLEDKPAERFAFPDKLISGSFIHDGQLYLIYYQEGLFRWSGSKLIAIGNDKTLGDEQMLFSFETAQGTFVGFESDMLYQFKNDAFKPVKAHLQRFLSENLLSDGLALNDSLMALSTLAGGAIVVNINSHELEYRFDYSTGAKDNEIFCLGQDGDDGLWLAYEDGLTRVDLLQPVRSFSGYPGLEGNITTSLMANGQLHVGTGNGVFVLRKATNQAEVIRMMDEMIRKRQAAKDEQAAAYVPPAPQVTPEESKADDLVERFKENPKEVKQELTKKEIRELKREIRKQRKEDRENKPASEVLDDMFARGGTDEKTEESSAEKTAKSGPDPMKGLIPDPKTGPAGSGMTAPPGSGGTKRSQPQVLKQETREKQVEADEQKLKALRNSYIFKKVKGIDVKCRQLININEDVFAATNNGLYLISSESATNLTPGMYINFVSATEDKDKLLLATLEGVHQLYKDKDGKWKKKSLDDSVKFIAYNVVQDAEKSIWAGTDNGAYRYTQNETRFYPITDVVNERVLVTNAYGEVHFLLPSSLYHYVKESDTILPASLPEVPTSEQLDYMLGDNGIVWIKSSYGWHVLNGEKFVPMLPYLDLFEEIRHLSTDDNGNVYVTDRGLNVYSLQHRGASSGYKFNVYIKQVVDAMGTPFSMDNMKIIADGNALIFSVSAPFYLKSKGTQYQYRIEGLRDNWSRWSDNPEIDPGNIPPGDYVLQVRARNILGEVSEIKTMAFSVPQPLFLRWYFLILYFLGLTLMILAIIKYRERSLRETQRILEERVAQRTSELETAKEKTEELLLNILPKETADELQSSGRATARHYNQVSVLFTDFKGFTQFAETTKPQDLVDELHRYFVKFDEIIGKFHLEKIKTIGDAYMCAGGVPIRNNSNAIAITLAALEIRDFMDQVAEEKRAKNEPILEIRIGIHTGPLTAGVVGMKKFAYDIWGDTVNTASRMESSSEPGRINVSGTTHELIKKYFETESRGQKQAKGKGLVEMYFVNGIKPEFSENGEGKVPNKGIWELIN